MAVSQGQFSAGFGYARTALPDSCHVVSAVLFCSSSTACPHKPQQLGFPSRYAFNYDGIDCTPPISRLIPHIRHLKPLVHSLRADP